MISTQNRNRMQNIVTIVLLLLVAGMLCWGSTRYVYESDWTSNGNHSLSTASIDVLQRLQETVVIRAYASDDPALRELIHRFVSRYEKHSDNIELEFRNPLVVVNEARNLGLRVDGELVLNYAGRTERVYTDSEEAFTNALQRLLKGTQRWVYFVEGHGERNPLNNEEHDYSKWAASLTDHGIRSQPFNLLETGAVPDNAAVLVIASPLARYTDTEVQLVIDYLERGGNLLWMSEPGEQAGLEPLQAYFSMHKPVGVIIDAGTRLLGISSPTIAVITRRNYPSHPATEGFSLSTFFPMSAAIQVQPGSDWRVKPLLQTGELSWLETGNLDGEVEYDPDSDTRGPVTAGLSLQRQSGGEQTEQRIVLLGDGDFLSNSYYGTGGNAKLGLRVLTWLSGDDSYISLGDRLRPDTGLTLENMTLGIIGLVFMVLLPAGLFLTGMTIWWRRRRL